MEWNGMKAEGDLRRRKGGGAIEMRTTEGVDDYFLAFAMFFSISKTRLM
jgi:hypothetical protein